MRQFLALLMISLSLSGAVYAQSSADFDLVKPTIDTFMDGASRNDATIHEQFWHDDLTYTSSNGTRFGKQQLMQGVISAGPTVPAEDYWSWYTAEEFSYKPFGDMVIINFMLVAHSESNAGYGREEYFNSGVLVWQDGRWQALNWQATKRQPD